MRGKRLDQEVIEKIVSLRTQGRSLGEITYLLGVSKTTAWSYIAHIRLAPDQRARITSLVRAGTTLSNAHRKGTSRRHNRLGKYPRWSAELVGCVAHFFFDGSVHRSTASYYNRSIALINTQRAHVQRFFGLEGKLLTRAGGVYRLDYYSVELVNHLFQLRAQLLGTILQTSKVRKIAYLRAFFDDEGNVDIRGRSRRVRGFQKDPSELIRVQALLTDIGIAASIDSIGKCVVISGRQNLLLFDQHVGFSPGILMNPLRKNSRRHRRLDKKLLLAESLNSYVPRRNQKDNPVCCGEK